MEEIRESDDQSETEVVLYGLFYAQCWNPDGTRAWADTAHNTATARFLDTIINVMFRGAANPIAAIYLLLVDSAGWTDFNLADTMAAHAGWAEFLSYSGSSRPLWSPGAPVSQIITNTAPVLFTITAAGTLKGLGSVSDPTKGGTSDLLLATAPWTTGDHAVTVGQTIQVFYQASMTAA